MFVLGVGRFLALVNLLVLPHIASAHWQSDDTLHRHERHHSLGSRLPRHSNSSDLASGLRKRYDDARFTFFMPGMGACGKVNLPSDFIVALNVEQWDGGAHCFDKIRISYGGKETEAQITDECPSCPFGALDMSPALFEFFASEVLGIIYGTWGFGTTVSESDRASVASSHPSTSKAKPSPTLLKLPALAAASQIESLLGAHTSNRTHTSTTGTHGAHETAAVANAHQHATGFKHMPVIGGEPLVENGRGTEADSQEMSQVMNAMRPHATSAALQEMNLAVINLAALIVKNSK